LWVGNDTKYRPQMAQTAGILSCQTAPCSYCGRFAVVAPAVLDPSQRTLDEAVATPWRVIEALRIARGELPVGTKEVRPSISKSGTVVCGWPDCPSASGGPPTPTPTNLQSTSNDGIELARLFLGRSPACEHCHRRIPTPYWCSESIPQSIFDAARPDADTAVRFRCVDLPSNYPLRTSVVQACNKLHADDRKKPLTSLARATRESVFDESIPMTTTPANKFAKAISQFTKEKNVAAATLTVAERQRLWRRSTLFAAHAPHVFTTPHPLLKAAGLQSGAGKESKTAGKADTKKRPRTEENVEVAADGGTVSAGRKEAPRQPRHRDEKSDRAATPVRGSSQESHETDAKGIPESVTTTVKRKGQRRTAAVSEPGADPTAPRVPSELSSSSSSEDDNEAVVHWAQCGLCGTWRVTSQPIDPGTLLWKCEDLGDGTKCKRKRIAAATMLNALDAAPAGPPGRGEDSPKVAVSRERRPRLAGIARFEEDLWDEAEALVKGEAA
jgi:hypothetical protein